MQRSLPDERRVLRDRWCVGVWPHRSSYGRWLLSQRVFARAERPEMWRARAGVFSNHGPGDRRLFSAVPKRRGVRAGSLLRSPIWLVSRCPGAGRRDRRAVHRGERPSRLCERHLSDLCGAGRAERLLQRQLHVRLARGLRRRSRVDGSAPSCVPANASRGRQSRRSRVLLRAVRRGCGLHAELLGLPSHR